MGYDDLPLFRAQDTPTSRAGAQHVRLRLHSQQALLLAVYALPDAIDGITDEEAGQRSGLAAQPRCCYWKRCSELRAMGFIVPTGDFAKSTAGELQRICKITAKGDAYIRSLEA